MYRTQIRQTWCTEYKTTLDLFHCNFYNPRYFELLISQTNFRFPCRFEKSGFHCTMYIRITKLSTYQSLADLTDCRPLVRMNGKSVWNLDSAWERSIYPYWSPTPGSSSLFWRRNVSIIKRVWLLDQERRVIPTANLWRWPRQGVWMKSNIQSWSAGTSWIWTIIGYLVSTFLVIITTTS